MAVITPSEAGDSTAFCIFTFMQRRRAIYAAIVWLLAALSAVAQLDTIRYRVTSFHGSVSQLLIISSSYPQAGALCPAALLSVKSNRTDSTYVPVKKLNFSIMAGIAASRYLFFEPKYFVNFLDKEPFHVFSKRFWGGFGINYRTRISRRLVLDLDMAPCIQIIIDKSEETKTDTSGWNSVAYSNIYQGLHANIYLKLEYQSKGDFKPFLSFGAGLPLLHYLAKDAGAEPYHNLFKAQLLVGAGINYSLKRRRVLEAHERKAKS